MAAMKTIFANNIVPKFVDMLKRKTLQMLHLQTLKFNSAFLIVKKTCLLLTIFAAFFVF
jgi:hypothetical protein